MSKKLFKSLALIVGVLFLAINIIAAVHAYKFSHFSAAGTRMENLKLTFGEELKLLFMGVDNPRPQNTKTPSVPYKTINIKSNVNIECWYMPTTDDTVAQGTIVIFHGYTSCKSAILNRADYFLHHGYNCMLVDFMGSGGSGGNQTTIGFYEAQEVKDCYEYLAKQGDKPIFLLGSSLGAVAIMKAIKDYQIKPAGVILECPFGTMYETIEARFRMLHVPPFPMAAILLFWGSVENGYWGFAHNPVEYARNINCPVLLQWGAHDDRVSEAETRAIFENLPDPKKLIIYARAGHDNYLDFYGDEWGANIVGFMQGVK